MNERPFETQFRGSRPQMGPGLRPRLPPQSGPRHPGGDCSRFPPQAAASGGGDIKPLMGNSPRDETRQPRVPGPAGDGKNVVLKTLV